MNARYKKNLRERQKFWRKKKIQPKLNMRFVLHQNLKNQKLVNSSRSFSKKGYSSQVQNKKSHFSVCSFYSKISKPNKRILKQVFVQKK